MTRTITLLSISTSLLLGACNADETLTKLVNNTTQVNIQLADHPELQYKLTLVERPEKTPRWKYMIVVDGKCNAQGVCEEALLSSKGYVGESEGDRAPWKKLLADPDVAKQACQTEKGATGRACEGNTLTVMHTETTYSFDSTSSLTALVDLRTVVGQLYRDAKPIDDGVKNPLGSDKVPYPLP